MTGAVYIVLRYGKREPDALMEAVVPDDGTTHHLTSFALRFRGFTETPERAAESLRRARRQPGPGLHRALKLQLYAAQYNAFRARMDTTPGAVAIVWNGLTGTRLAFASAARDAGRACIFVERAPLPGRITVDPRGVNAASSLPGAAAFYTDWAQSTPRPPGPGWRALGGKLVARASRRAGVSQGKVDGALPDRPFLFCPLQVQDDTQVTRFAGWCGGMAGFLAALSDAVAHLPEGWHLRLKEHPSSKRSLAAELAEMQARNGDRIVIDNTSDTFAQVAASRGVVTLNSSVGLQAFFHDKPVIVLGEALFRIPGVVCTAEGPDQLSRLFAAPSDLGFDADLRDAFMRYLDEVYYPPVTTDAHGRPAIDPVHLAPKFAAARAAAGARAAR